MNTLLKENKKEMNKFLKGIHMGGSVFKDYLEKAEDKELKNELKNIIESFKKHEEAITNRIEQIGENPPDTLGFFGSMADFFEKIKLITIETDKEVCDNAINAIDMGIKQGRKFIDENQNLEPSLLKEIKAVVNDYHIHLKRIEQIRNKYNK